MVRGPLLNAVIPCLFKMPPSGVGMGGWATPEGGKPYAPTSAPAMVISCGLIRAV